MVNAVARAPLALVTEERAAEPRAHAARSRDLLATAAWFALVGAAGELSLLAVRRFLLHEPIRVGPQVVWMTPAADLALLLLLALPLLLLARRWPRLGSPRVVAAVFAFLAGMGVLLVMNWSYRFGFVILALGLAAELGRRVADAPAGFQRLVRHTLPVMLLAVLLLGTGYNAYAALRERSILASLPAARAGSPNILLLIWDTVRASELSAYGYARPTSPVLAALARQGVALDQAISTAPWTLPSHAGMFTGRYPHEISARWQHPLNDQWPTIAEALSSHGYSTSGFVANTIYASYENGLQRGFAHYDDYGITPGQLVLASSLLRNLSNSRPLRKLLHSDAVIGRKSAADVNAAFLSWLDHRADHRPFFAFMNLMDAHEPYAPPPPYDTMFGPRPRLLRQFVGNHTNSAEVERLWAASPRQIVAERASYDGGIAWMDAQLGALVEQLRRRGALDNTVIIVASDHGEEFGEHRVFEHGSSLDLPVLHVPLVIIWPRAVPAGQRVGATVSLADLPATLLALARIAPGPFPGRSLTRFWDAAAPGRPGQESPAASEVQRQPGVPTWYPVHRGALHGVVADGFHLVRNDGGGEQLFDLARDPLERHNLAADPAYSTLLTALRPRVLPRPDVRPRW